MTANQIKYAEHLEGVRHNMSTEAETQRANRAAESIGYSNAAASRASAGAAGLNAQANYMNAVTRQQEYQLSERKFAEESPTTYITGQSGASGLLRGALNVLKWALN